MSRKIADLKYPVRERLQRLRELARLKGIEFVVTGTLRTPAEQFAYFAQGRLPLEEVNRLRKEAGLSPLNEKENSRTVTRTLDSAHLKGLAFDVALTHPSPLPGGEKGVGSPSPNPSREGRGDLLIEKSARGRKKIPSPLAGEGGGEGEIATGTSSPRNDRGIKISNLKSEISNPDAIARSGVGAPLAGARNQNAGARNQVGAGLAPPSSDKKEIVWDPKADINRNRVPDYEELGRLGESLGLTWGGRFKFRDYGHFELKEEKGGTHG